MSFWGSGDESYDTDSYAHVGPINRFQDMFLYKKGTKLSESEWYFGGASGAVNDKFSHSGELPFGHVCINVRFLQILHLDVGDTLELRMKGAYISRIILNIELIGFDYLV